MFDEIIREMEKQKFSEPRQIKISVPLDEKGFYDRECHHAECGGAFKVLFDDWGNKVSEARAFCPFCRHEAPRDEWNTEEQAEHIRTAAMAEMSRLVTGALKRGVERSRPTQINGGLIGIKMSLGYKARTDSYCRASSSNRRTQSGIYVRAVSMPVCISRSIILLSCLRP
jgi:hypothetical protein